MADRSGGRPIAHPMRLTGAGLLLLLPAVARAQSSALVVSRMTAGWSRTEATLAGRVTGLDGAPLGGARIALRGGTAVHIITRPNGTYRLVLPVDSLTPTPRVFQVTAPGHSPLTRVLTIGAGPQESDFMLRPDPLGRDIPVASLGVSEAPAWRLPVAAGLLTGRDLEEVPALTMAGGLAGRIPGVRQSEASGNPGSAPVLRLRGATSIGGSPAPLIIIDGTIAGTDLSDFSPEDIDRVEVAKGPAAAAAYGSNAANGVIQIFTRRGRELAEGDIAFTARNELGQSTTGGLANSSGAHPYQITTGAGGAIEFVRDSRDRRLLEFDGVSDNPYPAYHDQEASLFPSGQFLSNSIAIAGRRGSRTFRVSFQNSRSEGVVFGLDGFSRQNYRFNLDQRLGRRLEFSVSGAYANSSDRDALQEVGGPFFSWRFLEPNVDLLATNPNGTQYRAAIPDRVGNAANPLYRLANQVRTTDRSRLIGGGVVRWRAFDWLTAEGGYHADRERRDFSDLLPNGFLSADGIPTGGLYQTDWSEIQRVNFDGTLTALGRWTSGLIAARIGYVYEDESTERRRRAASGPDAGATEFSTSRELVRFHSAGLFAETSLELGNRVMVDAMTRREVVSMLAPGVRTPWYYRVAGGVRLFGESLARIAYGTTGLRSALEFALPGTDVAPEDVRAPYAAELEIGGHLGGAGGRVTLDYSFSRKRIRNQVGLAEVQGPTGLNQVPANIGVIESRSHEVGLGLLLLAGRSVQWSLALTADRIRQEITQYLLPERVAATGFQPAVFLSASGAALGVMYGTRAVRTIAELYDDPAKASQQGPGQDYDPARFVVNEEGYVVVREGWHTANERPITYVTCKLRSASGACSATSSLVPIGNGTPDFVAGVSTRFTWGGLGLSGLLAWSQGGDIYNGTRQWPFFENRDPVIDQRGKPELLRKPVAYYRSFFNGLNPQGYFVESGTFVKVRELSLSYTFRRGQLRKLGLGGMQRLKLGVVGRNLLTFTKYSGEDPEVSSLSADPFQQRIDWFGYPHFRTISGVVEIAF